MHLSSFLSQHRSLSNLNGGYAAPSSCRGFILTFALALLLCPQAYSTPLPDKPQEPSTPITVTSHAASSISAPQSAYASIKKTSESGGATALSPAALTVPLTPKQAQKKLLGTLALKAFAQPRLYHKAVSFGDPLFPPDKSWREDFYPQDPAFKSWLSLPETDRDNDILILPELDFYWLIDGVNYHVSFIVHFKDVSPSLSETTSEEGAEARTQITVALMEPMENHGKSFRWFGRAGPGWYWDLRAGKISETARMDLLNFIETALR